MLRRIYLIFGGLVLAGYVGTWFQGWELFDPHQFRAPTLGSAPQRHSWYSPYWLGRSYYGGPGGK